MALKAIETVYNGYRFRSRLEARWAVFFDALGVEYRYESEGFDLGEAGWYLPDFYLTQQNTWVEIKCDLSLDLISKPARFATMKAERSEYVLIVAGNPWPYEYTIMGFEDLGWSKHILDPEPWYFGLGGSDLWIISAVTWTGLVLDPNYPGYIPLIVPTYYTENPYNPSSCKLKEAYRAARQARFEHGEKGL